ncbi:MAG: NAD(P)/FAD-dependent oxidoreductase [Planctomycetes bacterium]|nr:NAD(P)/FAD-dependent oxidoreductase [Planctomycetota bacterium]
MGQTVPSTCDTLIIGAGMSGLAAGIRLAQYDQNVVVLDRHALWGGLNSFYKKAGRPFDVGLHALTNYVDKGVRGKPLTRILRQLRIPYDALKLGQQWVSESAFPGVKLRFSNDFQLMRSEVAEKFPSQIDGFDRLSALLADYPSLPTAGMPVFARTRLAEFLTDEKLVDLLLLPILYYGSPTPHDIEWGSFVVLWKSLYEEGFARPQGGVRTILTLLRDRYKELGGQLHMRQGVAKLLHENGKAIGVVLDSGHEIRASRILSSAGLVETMALCGEALQEKFSEEKCAGEMTFVECISLLDTPLVDLGHDKTITFFNTTERLIYEAPEAAFDSRSGVICCPDHYDNQIPQHEPALRLTLRAHPQKWFDFTDEEYAATKESAWQAGHKAILPFAPDIRDHTVFVDTFTPRTVRQFTGHTRGVVYGSPIKSPDGTTELENLFLMGTDQGFLGIVGAMLSGIAMANVHALQASPS